MSTLVRICDPVLAWERRLFARRAEPKGVLIVAAGGLGDAVLFAHVLPRFLALAGPGEPVTVVLRRDAAKMAFLFPKSVAVRAVDFDRLYRDIPYRRRTLADTRALNARLALSADYLRHPWLDEALIAAAEAPETAAMAPRPWPKHQRRLERNRALYARLFESGPPLADKIVRWTRFANWLTGRNDPPPVARLSGDTLPPPARTDRPLAVLQPFSAVARKQVPPEVWRAVIAALPADAEILVAGAPGDFVRHPEYAALESPPQVRPDTSTFAELVPTLRAARLVVSVDTALMHLAIAVGAPTLGLASAAYVGEIVPYDSAAIPPNAHFLYADMPCRGCLGDCRFPPDRGMYPCVARLDADAIAREAARLFGSATQKK
ncbi:MAG: glycosyltransferase family 9 protein [Alphaproteobacteria bacterium]|nr:glycosyltransferase family 9 protein [Alphaproteobacteria bacterium]